MAAQGPSAEAAARNPTRRARAHMDGRPRTPHIPSHPIRPSHASCVLCIHTYMHGMRREAGWPVLPLFFSSLFSRVVWVPASHGDRDLVSTQIKRDHQCSKDDGDGGGRLGRVTLQPAPAPSFVGARRYAASQPVPADTARRDRCRLVGSRAAVRCHITRSPPPNARGPAARSLSRPSIHGIGTFYGGPVDARRYPPL